MKYPRSAGSINPANTNPTNLNPTNPGRILPPRNFPRNRVAGAAALLLLLLLATGLQARTWTSTDGSKTFEGELKSYMDVGKAMSKAMADLLKNQK